jgi:L-alanine-DL-glutamate epimerase-like enolase superfamily enzyme
MGEEDFMKSQIEEKLAEGFTCIKLKIGAIDFKRELELLRFIRQNFTADQIEIRVDANGAFKPDDALEKMEQLAKFELHSIEQPIKANQVSKMRLLCENPPFPIALDEELIGVYDIESKQELLEKIKPQYIILKPSLIGGFKGTLEWISVAEKLNIGWWITSALESNIGLNAITQFTYTLKSNLPQGLGTGSLYTNNFDCPLQINRGQIQYNPNKPWNIENIA